jgi:hypothetical protein
MWIPCLVPCCQASGRRKTVFIYFLWHCQMTKIIFGVLYHGRQQETGVVRSIGDLWCHHQIQRFCICSVQVKMMCSSPWQGLIMQHFMSHYNIFSHFFISTPHVVSGSNIMQLPVLNNPWGWLCTISPVIALPLVLLWTRTCGSYAALQVIFGMTASNITLFF